MVKKDTWDKHWEEEETKSTFIGKLITQEKQSKLWEIALYDVHTVLEIGSGQGYLTEILEHIAEGYERWISQRFDYEGIDYSKKSVEICRSKNLNVRQADMFDLRKKYDLVMSDGILEHHLDYPRLIKKMCSLSNRYVMVIQPNHQSFIIRLLLLLEMLFKPDKNVYEYNFRIYDYEEEFKRNGFHLEKGEDIFFGGYVMLLFKRGDILP